MNYLELKILLGRVSFKIFHEVQNYKDYYFCFMRRNEINPELIQLLDKHQSISKKDFQKICHPQTADILEMADDAENDAYVYFIDILDIRSKEYIQQSLFLYKHIANIVSFKLFNSYFDEKTFKDDLNKVLNEGEEFKYIKHGKNSPSGLNIQQGNYKMYNLSSNQEAKEEDSSQFKSRTPEEVLKEHQLNKSTLEKEFNISDFEKIGARKSNDLADQFFDKIDNTTSFFSDVVSEATKNIKKTVHAKAPIVKKNATVVGKFIGKKIVNAVNEGSKIIEQKIKEDKIRRLKYNDLFEVDSISHLSNQEEVKIKKTTRKKKE